MTDKTIDELHDIVDSSPTYLERAEALLQLCAYYISRKNAEKLFPSSDLLLEISIENQDLKNQAWAILYNGMSYSTAKNYSRAMEKFTTALPLFEQLNDKPGIARTMMNIGRIHVFNQEFNEAKECYDKSLDIELQLGNSAGIMRVIANMSHVNTIVNKSKEHLTLLEQTIPVIEKLGNLSDVASILNQAALLSIVHLSANQSGKEYAERAQKICAEIGDMVGECTALDTIGAVYWYLGDAGRSIEYYTKCIAIAEQLDDPLKLAGHLTNAAYTYLLLNDYEKVLELNKRAKAIYIETGSESDSGWAEMGIGSAVLYLGYPSEAYEHNLRSISLLEQDNDRHGLGYAYFRCGEALVALERYDEAFVAFNRSLEYRKMNHSNLEIADTQCELAKLLIRFGLLDDAKVMLNSALERAEEIDAKAQIFAIHKALSEVFIANEDFPNAYKHLHHYISVRDEIQNQESAKKAASIEYLHHQELQRKEQEATDTILNNILPVSITKRLKSGQKLIADTIPRITVLFADIVGFTPLAARLSAEDLVKLLAFVFKHFDTICLKHGLEKIKTIGDAYMAVAGAPDPCENHAERCAYAALEMLEDFIIPADLLDENIKGIELNFRIGIHTGSAVAGVIGESKFAYDLWGDAVNTASRMESHGESGKIHVSEDFAKELEKQSTSSSMSSMKFTPRGKMDIKGKGMMKTYFLEMSNDTTRNT
ncbi:MAG: tetratricopeptide repeat protein [Ignavibacteriae bacterium]|nr:tetratricopeptide repeat protein [Ignavibacteriota bacterium]